MRDLSWRWLWLGWACVGCAGDEAALDGFAPADTDDDTGEVRDLEPEPADSDLAPDTSVDAADTPDVDAVDEDLGREDSADSADSALPDTGPAPCPWERWDQGLEGGRVDALAFDPRAPGTAWAISGGLVSRSIDGGRTWSGLAEGVSANHIAFLPNPKELLIAGVGLSVSYDGGQRFEARALTGLGLSALAVDPAVPQRVWAGVTGLGLLRSDDGGGTFYPRNVGLQSARVLSLAGFADLPDTLLVGSVQVNEAGAAVGRGRIYRTGNGGASFQVVHDDAAWVTRLVSCAGRPGLVYAAARDGARRSDDAGLSWRRVSGLEGLDVLDVALSADCETLYAVASGRGIYRLSDDDATVEGPMVAGLDLDWTRLTATISAHPSEAGVLLLGAHAGLFRSADGGFSWARVGGARGLVPTRLAWSGEAGRVWLATYGGGLWERAEGRWARAPRPSSDFLFSVAVDPEAPARMVVGAQGVGWASATGVGGLVARLHGVNVLDALSVEGEWLAATQTLGVYRSADGVAWTASNEGIAAWPTPLGVHLDVRALAAGAGGRRYAGTRGRGVVLSEDRGRSWRFVDNILAQRSVTRVLTDVADPDRVYALTEELGVFVSEDGAETFAPLGTGHESLALTALVQDPVSGTLYVAQSRGPVEMLPREGTRWTPFRRFCEEASGFVDLVVQDTPERRWLVGVRAGNRVLRTPLE